MANPSETYAVDSTLTFGTTEVNLTKKLSTLYPTVNSEIDNSIAINKFNDDLVKTVYRKSDKYNSLFDNSITIGASPAGGSNVVKYYARNGFPTDSANITNAISYGANSENRVYSTGYSGDASAVYNANGAGDLKFIRDLEYNKILFAITAKEYSNISVLPKGTIDYAHGSHETPSTTGVDLKDIDPNKYYMGYDDIAAKVWNGSGWSDIQAHPILVCNGETVQSIQSAGTAFYSEIDGYGMIMGSGQNISISVSSTNQMNYGYNFCNAMDRAKYTLGWADSYSAAPNWIDIKDSIFQQINQHMIDNNQYNMSCTISREIINVSDNMSMLLSVVGQFYRNSSGIYSASINTMMYPILKGSALLKLLAGFGCYYRADSSLDLSEITPNTLGAEGIWLGEMSSDGTTTGNWIKGTNIDSYTGYNKDGSTTNPDFDPSGGGGGGDDDDPSDDQASGGIYGGAQGMCNLYYMTAGEIKDLQNWFRGTVFAPGIQIPADFDPSNQLIGLAAFPIELGGSVDSTTITFRTGDNQAVNTGVSCQKAYGDDLKFDMGTINIPARMQERGVPFLDYSSQIEVYIPFCDVVQLDVQQVIGTTLKCEMWISPATGDVSAMLSSGTHPVAYTSGNCAQQLPISVGSYGAIAGARLAADNKMTQAVFQAAQNVVKDITNAGAITSAVSNHTAVNGQGLVEFSRIPQVQSNTGLAVGAGIKAAGNVVNTALALTAQNFDNKYALQVAKNSAPTHVSGSFGTCTSWHFPNYCYVKITRPHFQKPDNYGHTEAVPVVATKQLSSLSGLTICVNPDVSGIGTATMQELETIKNYLMSGVIL